MVSVEEFFGARAGDVWNALHENGAMSVRELARKTGLPGSLVWAALGWLGREGKIRILGVDQRKRGLDVVVELTE